MTISVGEGWDSVEGLDEPSEGFAIPVCSFSDDELAYVKLLQEIITAYANDQYIKLSRLLDEFFPMYLTTFDIDDINDAEEVQSKTDQLEIAQEEFEELQTALLLLSNSPYEVIDRCTQHIQTDEYPDNYFALRALAYFEITQDELAIADLKKADLLDDHQEMLLALQSKLGITIIDAQSNSEDISPELAAFIQGDYSEAKRLAKQLDSFNRLGGDFKILLLIHCVENRDLIL